jgi:hypothetical protein
MRTHTKVLETIAENVFRQEVVILNNTELLEIKTIIKSPFSLLLDVLGDYSQKKCEGNVNNKITMYVPFSHKMTLSHILFTKDLNIVQ